MSLVEYHKSIGKELNDLKNRFRDLLGDEYHKLTDGKHKESILREVLTRHLPKGITAQNGFIKFNENLCSSEIDILLYSNDRPILFQNSDIIITTPHAVMGAIEVKTDLTKQQATEAFAKIAINAKRTMEQLKIAHWESFNQTFDFKNMHNYKSPWFSLFSYSSSIDDESVLECLDVSAAGDFERVTDCVCLGPDKFIRFWSGQKKDRFSNEPAFVGWRLYELKGLAFSYFISNMIWQDHVMTTESNPWFALEDKGVHMVCERPFTRSTPQESNG